jgi:hypothetical protein
MSAKGHKVTDNSVCLGKVGAAAQNIDSAVHVFRVVEIDLCGLRAAAAGGEVVCCEHKHRCIESLLTANTAHKLEDTLAREVLVFAEREELPPRVGLLISLERALRLVCQSVCCMSASFKTLAAHR